MANYVSNAQAERCRKLLKQGYMPRAVAQKTGISHTTIEAIKQGKWKPHNKVQAQSAFKTETYHRCPGCRGLVKLPCLLCEVRKLKAKEKAKHEH